MFNKYELCVFIDSNDFVFNSGYCIIIGMLTCLKVIYIFYPKCIPFYFRCKATATAALFSTVIS